MLSVQRIDLSQLTSAGQTVIDVAFRPDALRGRCDLSCVLGVGWQCVNLTRNDTMSKVDSRIARLQGELVKAQGENAHLAAGGIIYAEWRHGQLSVVNDELRLKNEARIRRLRRVISRLRGPTP